MTSNTSPKRYFSDLAALCKRRGFIFPSSEIYGGINAVWDYGPLGVRLKRNLKSLWWNAMVELREDIEGLDAAILMHPQVWEASGHVEGFVDPLMDCKKCKKRFREDHLDEKARTTHVCPACGGTLTEPKLFHLMFQTQLGAVASESMKVYLRPETAQGIYVNFQNVLQSMRKKLPFGIAQIGKAFRNEVTTGNFIFRMREFEQMEMQFFVRPEDADQWFEYWKEERLKWYLTLGFPKEHLVLHPHRPDELAHYAKMAFDIQYCFPMGAEEIEGIHHRTDFDLKRHQKMSKKRLELFDEKTKKHFIPYVVETSAGCDRIFLALLQEAFQKDKTRIWLKLPPKIAPFKIGIFPLLKKTELITYAKKLYDTLRTQWSCFYDEGGSIGKRYRRQDEIGTPYGVTIDYETLRDHAVTIRDRDTMQQRRVQASKIQNYFETTIPSSRF